MKKILEKKKKRKRKKKKEITFTQATTRLNGRLTPLFATQRTREESNPALQNM